MAYLTEMDPKTGFVDMSAVKKGGELRASFEDAKPFPYVVIEDFLPQEIIDRCIEEFSISQDTAAGDSFDRAQERLKRSMLPDTLSDDARRIFYSFNARPFLGLLENITGIKGLIPDPYFFGGGFHEIGQGGHLSIHADFNHHKPMNLERRVNVLIYLNKDWSDDYGGQLELWNDDMTKCEVSVVPMANRCVIFNTSSTSNHGNPNPINHPGGITRKSIALYYYTATWSTEKRDHTTQFRVRPKSQDKFDWTVALSEGAESITPPILWRAGHKLLGKKRAPKTAEAKRAAE